MCSLLLGLVLQHLMYVSSSFRLSPLYSKLIRKSPYPIAMSSTATKLRFKQLFDDDSSTYTYLLYDSETKDGILIDPVDLQVERDLREIETHGLKLLYGVNTHAHADHITGTGLLKQRVPGLQSIISLDSEAKADIKLQDGDQIRFGNRYLTAIATPGHTSGCMSFVADDKSCVFTGDALLIHGCGRTDFQSGDAGQLYDSIHSKIYSLPDECVVYPAHDYIGRTSSTIGNEKQNNPRLTKSKSEFVEIMNNLNLPYPKRIDAAVPANMRCGVPDLE
jgi:sulfur dioxygenase